MKKFYIFVLGILFLSLQLKAQWTQLNDPLLQGATMFDFFKTINGVYATTNGGIFYTANEGNTWSYVNNIDTATNSDNQKTIVTINDSIYFYNYFNISWDELTFDESTFLSVNKLQLFILKNGTWKPTLTTGLPGKGNMIGLGAANNKLFRFNIKNFETEWEDSTYIYWSNDGNNWNKGMLLNGWPCFKNLSCSEQYFELNDSLFMTNDGINKIVLPLPQNVSSISNGNLSGEPNGNYIYYSYYPTDSSNSILLYRLNINQKPLQWENITSNITTEINAMIPEVSVSDNVIFSTVFSKPITGTTFRRSIDHGTTFQDINPTNCGLRYCWYK